MSTFSTVLTIFLIIIIYQKLIPHTLLGSPAKALKNGLSSPAILSPIVWVFGAVFRIIWALIQFFLNLIGSVLDIGWFKNDRYGTAKWLTGFQKEKILNTRHDGFVIDGVQCISKDMSYKGLSLIAPTGGGKTSRFIIPNIMQSKNQSLVITDPSGEIFKICAGRLRKNGYQIKVFNVEGLQTLTYNPLHRASSSKEIGKLAQILVESSNPSAGNNGDHFWVTGAQNILSILIRTIKNAPLQYQNIANVRYLLNNFGTDGSPLNELIARYSDEATYQEFKGFIATEEKVISGFIATARTSLEIFTDDELCTLTATETLHFETLRSQKTALFIQVPETSVKFHAPLLTILYAQIFDFLMQPNGNIPVMCLMDEFGNLGAIPGMETIMTTIRKRNVAIALILQDLQQLTATYGQERASIIMNGGTASSLILGGLSIQSCQNVSAIMGITTVEENDLLSLLANEEPVIYGRNLMNPDEIRTLSGNEALFIHGNLPPAKVTMLPYFKNRRLKRWAKITPPRLNAISRKPITFIPLVEEVNN